MQFAAERNVVEFVRDFARDYLIAIVFTLFSLCCCCSQEPIPDERGREVRVVVLELSHIISRNDARARFSRVMFSFRDGWICPGKRPQNRQLRDRSSEGLLFSLSLSFAFARAENG